MGTEKMSIEINNLDDAYDTLKELIILATKIGPSLLGRVSSIIQSDQANNAGNDVNVRVAKMQGVYNEINATINEINQIISDASEPIIKAQIVRNFRSGGAVGESLTATEENGIGVGEVESTDKYIVDKDNVSSNANMIDQVYNDCVEFGKKVQVAKETLFTNWKSGSGRDEAKKAFEDFDTHRLNREANIKAARDNFKTVVNNVQNL